VFRAACGVDVRPHPHIGLATVTYLFDGEVVHRDSLGTAMPIRPGEVNWMTAVRNASKQPRLIGRPAASIWCPAIQLSSFRCQRDAATPAAKPRRGVSA
jgi:hypothetical protein